MKVGYVTISEDPTLFSTIWQRGFLDLMTQRSCIEAPVTHDRQLRCLTDHLMGLSMLGYLVVLNARVLKMKCHQSYQSGCIQH